MLTQSVTAINSSDGSVVQQRTWITFGRARSAMRCLREWPDMVDLTGDALEPRSPEREN